MTLTVNYCYRIYPDATQEQTMLHWLEISRQVYNYALREIKDWVNSRKCSLDRCSLEREYIIPADQSFPTYYIQQNALPKAKKAFPLLGEAPAQVLQTTIRRLHEAWNYFQNRGFGFPRFKKFGQMKSMLFPQFKTNPITGWQIALPKVGKIPINLHRPIPEGFVVKQARVLRKADRWEVVLTIESDVSIPEAQPHGDALGIDLGLEKFLTTSDREFIARPRFLTSLYRELKLLQRKYARTKPGSKNREKARIRVARFHNHITNVRKDWQFKLANHLCKKDGIGMIFVEDLNLKAMSRGMLRKHTLDAAFGQFLNLLEWVAKKHQIYFLRVNPDGTSQTCPKCNTHTGKKDLQVRVHRCGECGYETHRDRAAAEVIRLRGLELMSTQGLCGRENAYAVGLPRIEETLSRSEAKPRKGRTRNAQQ
ncbi:transposase [Desertifilum sp. FACHB-1129]|uniref:Transposase n=2 Tax=Desertifilum tharense IPPAS B-1220 TaxID=1781255 RepID=A0A1E5QLD0_9CYAN|nr:MULTISPECIES: RNA-guided endonuclease TnpB family protein [Desertifilum]MDA0212835.1 transposase [Cyanobacteria bacterium FC1]MBD2314459.1 transposase [Desertifilum sp. FACHB-1129]MBD2321708.1 transposase [Desertifilum sp. FACHB-866]MBD2331835.1 transposase [Desertifilum sp. FACHB-868]OEJ75377.1 transposase [Desertifilum tharense IPPAS B-1220]